MSGTWTSSGMFNPLGFAFVDPALPECWDMEKKIDEYCENLKEEAKWKLEHWLNLNGYTMEMGVVRKAEPNEVPAGGFLLETGDCFISEPPNGFPKRKYKFCGFDMMDKTGCAYIVIENTETGERFGVERLWFDEAVSSRKIRFPLIGE